MKLSEMSNEEKSRWIAEKLEPTPAFLLVYEDPTSYRYSSGRMWAWSNTEDIAPSWQPRDFITDPAMTLMLLEKLMNDKRRDCFAQGLRSFVRYHAELGQLVADCWMLSMGFGQGQ